MADNRRGGQEPDRRTRPRGGRRDGDQKKPWYMRRRLWLAVASVLYVRWRRVTGRRRMPPRANNSNMAA